MRHPLPPAFFFMLFPFLVTLACTPGRIQTQPVLGEVPRDLSTGKKLFISKGCFQCHGSQGNGDGMMAASLKRPPRDFRKAGAFQGGTDPRQLAFTIKYASQWSRVTNQVLEGMPDYSALSDEELLALAAWVRFLQTNSVQ
mgnify:CR=1 FL=1